MSRPDSPVTLTTQAENNKSVDQALKLLEQVTSIRVVGEFLKGRGLASSAGSWAELRDKRIKPSLDDGSLTRVDLYGLLGELEEYGSSHIFLYSCKRDVAKRLLDEQEIRRIAKASNLQGLVNTPIILDEPKSPTITEIRCGQTDEARSLAIKVIESREHRKFLGETVSVGRLTKEWEITTARAVNVLRLSPSGLLEVRIQRHVNSTRYQDDVTRIWSKASPFIPISSFQPFSLATAKGKLWEQRAQLEKRLRFSDSRMRNDFGYTVSAATGDSQADLFEDDGVKNSMDVFLRSGAYCDSSNIWWIKQEDGIPSTDLHVMLSGMDNEFAVPANCSREDYEYVLNQLKKASH